MCCALCVGLLQLAAQTAEQEGSRHFTEAMTVSNNALNITIPCVCILVLAEQLLDS